LLVPVVEGVHDYEFIIFDRWGERLFSTTDFHQGWNGYHNGGLCTNDVFVYKISYKDDVDKKFHQFVGRVTLVR
jgi:gliding motility-associated-like protein